MNVETYVKFMEETAKDDTHGYDQVDRYGKGGNYDCSGLVITALEKGGFNVKKYGATYTGNLRQALLKVGFEVITHDVNRNTGDGMKRGDILLNESHHVAVYCGNGKEVEASINEKGTVTGGKSGDQTGKEILIRNYRNYPWTHVLRYTEKKEGTKMTTITGSVPCKAIIDLLAKNVISGKYGSGDTRKNNLGVLYDTVQKRVNEMLK